MSCCSVYNDGEMNVNEGGGEGSACNSHGGRSGGQHTVRSASEIKCVHPDAGHVFFVDRFDLK